MMDAMLERNIELGSSCGALKPNAAADWRAPAGHATWCTIAVPYGRRSLAGGRIVRDQCTCAKSKTARLLRALADRRA